jgi:hypothetical protein
MNSKMIFYYKNGLVTWWSNLEPFSSIAFVFVRFKKLLSPSISVSPQPKTLEQYLKRNKTKAMTGWLTFLSRYKSSIRSNNRFVRFMAKAQRIRQMEQKEQCFDYFDWKKYSEEFMKQSRGKNHLLRSS